MIKHICVPTERAIQELLKGNNIFDCSANEAMTALIRQRNSGKEFYTGCDHEDERGQCAGHNDSNPELLNQ